MFKFQVLPRVARSATSHRSFATISSPSHSSIGSYQIFDRNAKRLQKDRAVVRDGGARSTVVDYIRDEVADRMMERFLDIKREFNTILDLGAGPGHFSKLLEPEKTKKVIMVDSSELTLNRDADLSFEGSSRVSRSIEVYSNPLTVDVERIHGNEENLLEIVGRESQEAIVSCLSLQWVNDLPGILIQIKEALLPDGLFLGAMFGGETLFELRTSLQLAETEREGGISPHISPMTDTRDISNLLGRAGFTLLTVDIDEIQVGYPSMWELMEDLKDMGEGNAVIGRRPFIHRDTLAAASAIYKELHGKDDGTIPATFQVIYMIGWKPAASQPKPLDRGTGKINLKDVL